MRCPRADNLPASKFDAFYKQALKPAHKGA
jgi:hypothetical protein